MTLECKRSWHTLYSIPAFYSNLTQLHTHVIVRHHNASGPGIRPAGPCWMPWVLAHTQISRSTL